MFVITECSLTTEFAITEFAITEFHYNEKWCQENKSENINFNKTDCLACWKVTIFSCEIEENYWFDLICGKKLSQKWTEIKVKK